MSADRLRLGRGVLRIGAVCLCVLAPAIPAVAQTSAAIAGTITDAQGGALPGVALTLRNSETGNVRTGAGTTSRTRPRRR
jgi:hypothetical protein